VTLLAVPTGGSRARGGGGVAGGNSDGSVVLLPALLCHGGRRRLLVSHSPSFTLAALSKPKNLLFFFPLLLHCRRHCHLPDAGRRRNSLSPMSLTSIHRCYTFPFPFAARLNTHPLDFSAEEGYQRSPPLAAAAPRRAASPLPLPAIPSCG